MSSKVVKLNPELKEVEEAVAAATGAEVIEDPIEESIAEDAVQPQLAIMKHVAYGICPYRQLSVPALYFATYVSEDVYAVQIYVGRDADAIIMSAGVKDIAELEGKPCWVNVDKENQQINFLGVSRI
jgi:hypothetical protein